GLAASIRRGGDADRDLRAERRAVERERVKLSVVIPAHNEEGSISATVRGLVDVLEREGIEHEIVVVDDASTDGTLDFATAAGVGVRGIRSHYPPGFGFAVRSGLDVFTGDAVAIVMADGSDSPEDVVAYHRLLEQGYDCAFGSRFIRGSVVREYPWFK